MLFRKIESYIADYLNSGANKALIVEGSRQIGKSYIIRHVGKTLFKNFVEVNFVEDKNSDRLFENVRTISDFYLQIGIVAGAKLGKKENTLIFLDEIQEYPHLLTLLKFLKQDDKYQYIASGSLLGITLAQTVSIPIGSIEIVKMYALDFEEFLIANGVGQFAIASFREKFLTCQELEESTHNKLLDLFRKYLIVGGMPDAVNEYLRSKDINKIRKIQNNIHHFYALDAAKYDHNGKLKIQRIFEMIPSAMENKKKRIVVKNVENKIGKRYENYQDAFDFLINAGVALEVKAISNPKFPLLESSTKNLLKLYLNDVGLLSNVLYRNNINAILNDEKSVNLGAIYEMVAASELSAHGHKLYYYDNKKRGEVDYLIDDYENLAVLPLEIKSGKDYSTHRALANFSNNDDYNIKRSFVFSNERKIKQDGVIAYLPIYYIMFV